MKSPIIEIPRLVIAGTFNFVCRDRFGREKWQAEVPNGVVNEGLNYALDAALAGQTAITTWFIGLLEGTFSHVATATLASLPSGATELASGTDYTEAGGTVDRYAWLSSDVAASQSLANDPAVDFPMLTTKTVTGAFLGSAITGTTGTLFCTAGFTGQPVNNGDTLSVTYTVNASNV